MRIEMDQADLIKAKTMLAGVKNGVPKVMTRAINKTITNVRVKAVKEIGKELNLKVARIRKDFIVEKANFSKLNGKLIAKGKPIGLISFKGTRQIKKGVSVKVKTNGQRKVIRHAFIATAKTAINVWRREYKGTRKPWAKGRNYAALPYDYRYKINRLTGPRIEDIYGTPEVMNPVEVYSGERLKVNMNHELDYELSKL